MDSVNRPASMFASLGIWFVFTNLKASMSISPFIYCFKASKLSYDVYRGSDVCKISDGSCALSWFVR